MASAQNATPSTPESTGLKAAMDDNVLNPVAASQRMSGWSLLANTAGVGTTLAMLLIGGTASYLVGTQWAIAMAAVSALFGSAVGMLTGRASQSTGMSSTVSMRFHGLGASGSSLASLIFAFMILGFLALENVLLYYGTLFMLGWAPNLGNAVLIYGLLSLLWILLTIFGMKVVQKTSLVLTIIAGVLMLWVGFVAFQQSGLTVGEVLAARPGEVTPVQIMTVLSMMIGMAGALSLVGADFARYARTPKDVGIMAVGGNIIVNFLVVSLGALLYQAGDAVVARFLSDSANAGIAAAQQGGSIVEKVQYLAHSNPGAYFVILSGFLGFLVMYAAQIKAQVINTYSGSLTLANLYDAVLGRKPNRIAMVVAANVIALISVWANILGVITQYLGLLGILTFSLCALVIADFFIVRKRRPADTAKVERFNWAGLIAVVAGSGVSYFLTATGIFPLGFLLTLVLTPLIYVLLRRSVLPEGAGTSHVPGTAALRDDDDMTEPAPAI
ncbi:cytosine permease [Arthrobacter sp. I2-34]|uniref:Cytosine permease n=1 Tax=Arthrobacter hankyongi TaxID=2904801 RepID=A0ABS9L7W0_9MICC|nr:cytosine permease [Arthrobacter hankyongi]MCG2622582.1 cytosine permease [Arthrobacter hankyongi]